MASQEPITTTIEHIQASRYLSAAGVVIILYDHLLTLNDEINLMWVAEWKAPKILFLIIRYTVPVAVIIHTYQMSGLSETHLTDYFCQVWFSIATMLGMISIMIANFIVLLHVWNLWDRQKGFIIWTLVLFVVTQIANLVCSAYTVMKMIPALEYSDELRLCALSQRSSVEMLWVPGIVFDVLMFCSVLYNALQRPRSLQTDFAKTLYRDGLIFFVILFSLRVANLVLAIVAPLSLIFLGVFFVWCSTTTTVARLVLDLRRISVSKGTCKRKRTSGRYESQEMNSSVDLISRENCSIERSEEIGSVAMTRM